MKKGVYAVLAVLFFFTMAFGSMDAPAHAATDSSSTTLTVHYLRFNNDYENWNLWMWPYQPVNGDGQAYTFNGTDSFGAVSHVSVPGDNTEVGIIVRKGNWKERDGATDRYIDVSKGHEVWLVQGVQQIFYNQTDAEKAASPAVSNAYLDGAKTVLVKLNQALKLSGNTSNFSVQDQTTGKSIPVTSVENANSVTAVVTSNFQKQLGASSDWNPGDHTTQLHKVNDNLYQFTANLKEGSYQYKIALNDGWNEAYPSQNINLTIPAGGKPVTISYIPSEHKVVDSINNPGADLPSDGSGVTTDLVKVNLGTAPDVTHTLTVATDGYTKGMIIPRNVLNSKKYFYKGNDLGTVYKPSKTAFKVWAPTASKVNLLLYKSVQGKLAKRISMKKGANGVWTKSVRGNLANWYYTYEVTNRGVTQEAVDPYATGIAPNGTRGMIVDLKKTNPPGWKSDKHITPKNIEDEIIYELHIRDFSIDQNSGMKHKGQYLAFTEKGTKGPDGVKTGVDHLKQLGITHVQVMPAFAFNSIDETKSGQYNWGYDPRNYNVPEGAYATTPYGTARITQFKQMVQALHRNHIGVNMDVVYNHTFAVKISDFDKIVPQYYYRTDDAGNYTNGSGVGNEIAAERPMVQKFILDSLKYWVKAYHVDGFRFDLMALLGKDTMKKASTELHAMDPGIALYGEPWTGGTSALPSDQLLTKGQQKGMNVAVFNDNLRNALDGNVFDSSAKGFATGATGLTDAIKKGVEGSINDFTASPGETINYVTSHDNYTLWDKISKSNPSDTEANRIKMDELAQAVVMTSQGVPFMQGGAEFLRTKGGNDNSYQAGDKVNEFDWSRKAQYPGVFNYYRGLIQLRRAHPAFRMTTAAQIKKNLTFLDSPDNTVAFELANHANKDKWGKIIVVYNPNQSPVEMTIPTGRWAINAQGNQIGVKTLGHATNKITVPGISMMVLHQQARMPLPIPRRK